MAAKRSRKTPNYSPPTLRSRVWSRETFPDELPTNDKKFSKTIRTPKRQTPETATELPPDPLDEPPKKKRKVREFRFNDKHGANIVLSRDKKTAQRFTKWDERGGIVMSENPMEINTLYEVQVQKTDGQQGWVLPVGVVTSEPSDPVPLGSAAWSKAVVVCKDTFTDHGISKNTYGIGRHLFQVPVESRIGVCVKSSGYLHIYFNSADQGPVVPEPPIRGPCWAMFDMCGTYTQITALPLTKVD